MITIIGLCLLIIAIGFIIGLCAICFQNEPCAIVSITITICVVIILSACAYIDEPSAMDVYRGRTELKYTVVDNQKVDSIVVYKEKFKNY